MNPNQSHIYQIFMKKKIYTFSLILFAFLFALYFVWSLAANIQKEALKQHLSNEWAVTLSEEKITTDGFPFKFGIKVSNFQSTRLLLYALRVSAPAKLRIFACMECRCLLCL